MKLLEIGPYPPPNSGWSVRIKYLKEACDVAGYQCQVLNIGATRRIKSQKYIDVQNGFDYIRKLMRYRSKGYRFHIHMNAHAVKGPLMVLTALLISRLTLDRAAVTFHGGIRQLYFPRKNAGKMYGIIYLIFLLAGDIICNDEKIRKHIVGYGPWIRKQKVSPIQAFSVQYLNYKEEASPSHVETFLKTKKNIVLCYVVLRKGFNLGVLVNALKRLDSDTGIILSGIRNVEDPEVEKYLKVINTLKKKETLITVDNLNHDQFMTLLQKSHVYLRTYVSDGVASSVLEALSLGVPVVASENGHRPPGVVTYPSDNSDQLLKTLTDVLGDIGKYKTEISKPIIRDTVKDEIDLLLKDNRK